MESTCNLTGSCVRGPAEEDCQTDVTILVIDELGATALSGVDVALLDPPFSSGTTNANGEVILTLPIGRPIGLLLSPTATHWGLRTVGVVAPGLSTIPLELTDEATVISRHDVEGVAAVDDSAGILEQQFFSSAMGGESAAITPSCAQSSCGPVSPNASGTMILSNTTQSGASPPRLVFINLPAGSIDVVPSGAPGMTTCTLFDNQENLQGYARTGTRVVATCAPL